LRIEGPGSVGLFEGVRPKGVTKVGARLWIADLSAEVRRGGRRRIAARRWLRVYSRGFRLIRKGGLTPWVFPLT